MVSKKSEAKFKIDGNYSGLPVIVDDVTFTSEIKNRIVNSFTGCGEADKTAHEAFRMRSGNLLATNFTMKDLER